MHSYALLAVLTFVAITFHSAEAGCKAGEQWKPKGECTIATCAEDGSYSKLGCARIFVSEGWKLTEEDLTKEYPACCPQAVKV